MFRRKNKKKAILERVAKGGEIIVERGTYAFLEPIRLRSRMHIKGQGRVIFIAEKHDQPIFEAQHARDIVLENLILITYFRTFTKHLIFFRDCIRPKIINVRILGYGVEPSVGGICILGGKGAVIERCSVQGFRYGIFLSGTSKALVHGGRIDRCPTGVYVYGGTDNTITQCTIKFDSRPSDDNGLDGILGRS